MLLALVIKKASCLLFIVDRNDRPNKEVCDGNKENKQKNNLSLLVETKGFS